MIPLDAVAVLPVSLLGAKAANLARMLAAGLPVPRGFCVTTHAYRQWFDTCPAVSPFLERLERLDSAEMQVIRSVAAELRQTLTANPVPAAVANAVIETCSGYGENLAWAVRSSATSEDGHETSFAGQHDTLLNVRGPAAVVDAVRHCWISLFTDRVVAYRLRNHLLSHSAAMAVLVQEMVPANSAGVVFTSDPLTGDPGRIVIEGAPGLGDALVSGKVNPDRYVVARDTLEVIDRQLQRAAAGTTRGDHGPSRARNAGFIRQGFDPCQRGPDKSGVPMRLTERGKPASDRRLRLGYTGASAVGSVPALTLSKWRLKVSSSSSCSSGVAWPSWAMHSTIS